MRATSIKQSAGYVYYSEGQWTAHRFQGVDYPFVAVKNGNKAFYVFVSTFDGSVVNTAKRSVPKYAINLGKDLILHGSPIWAIQQSFNLGQELETIDRDYSLAD